MHKVAWSEEFLTRHMSYVNNRLDRWVPFGGGGASRSDVIIPIPSFLLAFTLCLSDMSKKCSLKRINILNYLDKLGILLYNDEPYLSRLSVLGKIHSASACINTIIKRSYNFDINTCFNITTRTQDKIQNNSLGPLSMHLSFFSLNLCSRLLAYVNLL